MSAILVVFPNLSYCNFNIYKDYVVDQNSDLQAHSIKDPIFKIFRLTVGIGYYWLYIQNTKSGAYILDGQDTIKEFEIFDNKKTGYFFEIGLGKKHLKLLASFYRWESLANSDFFVEPELVSYLSVNSLSIKSEFSKDIISNRLFIGLTIGTGFGWGQLTQPMFANVVESYSFEPSFSIGTGIEIYVSNASSLKGSFEFEKFSFSGNPNFDLENLKVQIGVRLHL